MPASWTSRGSVLIRLARQHFAFYRGYLDGLDLRLLAERYPGAESSTDGNGSVTTSGKPLLNWITQQLVVEAERCGERSAARLLRLQTAQGVTASQPVQLPTLAEFQEERDPYHMYSEGELLELFELEYPSRTGGTRRIAQRNRRLRRRQEVLLQLIESRIRLEPGLDDPVSAWIDSGLANYLIKAQIHTLGDLHRAIEAYGFHWYRRVPRIGVKAARHITGWLLLPATREALGVTLTARGTIPPRQIGSEQIGPILARLDVVPLERLALPTSLSGLRGANRGVTATISAVHDVEAIEAWLLKMKPGSHTARACRKEAERFLLWCVLEAKKPVSSADMADVQRYLHFLGHLGRQSPQAWAVEHSLPQESWLGPRGIDRWSVRWRPFEGPLSMPSQRVALSLLKGLFRFLHSVGYLHTNPCAEARIPAMLEAVSNLDEGGRKTLLPDEWLAAWSFLQSQPESVRLHRIKLMLLLLKETGCRLSELTAVERSALSWEGRHLCLKLFNDRGPDRAVLLSDDLSEAVFLNYRRHGLAELDSVPPSTPLITAISKETGSPGQIVGLSGSRIYRILKDYFNVVADNVSAGNADLAVRLRQISIDSFLTRV